MCGCVYYAWVYAGWRQHYVHISDPRRRAWVSSVSDVPGRSGAEARVYPVGTYWGWSAGDYVLRGHVSGWWFGSALIRWFKHKIHTQLPPSGRKTHHRWWRDAASAPTVVVRGAQCESWVWVVAPALRRVFRFREVREESVAFGSLIRLRFNAYT